MLYKWKHIVCILQLASCFICFHRHQVPVYKHTAVQLGMLLLVDSLVVPSIMNSATWNNLTRVSWCPRAGVSQCIYITAEFLMHRLDTESTCLGKVKFFQSQFPSSTPTSTDEHSCCFIISPTFGTVQPFNFCQSDGYEIHSPCSFNLQPPDYQWDGAFFLFIGLQHQTLREGPWPLCSH